MNLHLVSFGDTVNYGGALTRMLVTASQWFNQNKQMFTTISILNQQHLQQDKNFWSQHNHFFKNHPKGYGYWLWKSWAIKSVMAKLPENDIILYLDVGCQLNPSAVTRFHDYCNLAAAQGICCFQLPGFTEHNWNKSDTAFRVLGDYNSPHMQTDQIMATVVFFLNNRENKQLVDTWYEISQDQNYKFLTDENSVLPNHSTFCEHRHDQSILSLLIKQSGYIPLLDETWFHPNWRTKGVDYPIWATRNNTSQVI
mgnify:FL=1|tara:strand:+ start:487 stop:1248 length:762 start_codon:yes stop_codon:yes gene_type:complete